MVDARKDELGASLVERVPVDSFELQDHVVEPKCHHNTAGDWEQCIRVGPFGHAYKPSRWQVFPNPVVLELRRLVRRKFLEIGKYAPLFEACGSCKHHTRGDDLEESIDFRKNVPCSLVGTAWKVK